METQTVLPKFLSFFLTKIIIGVSFIVGVVVLVEWSGRSLLASTQFSENFRSIILAIAESALALWTYTFLFRVYEKRKIGELSTDAFRKNAVIGFTTGFVLQSIFILIIYLTGNYSVIRINQVSSLLPSFAAALTAGFVGEIVIRGIFFRLTEEKLGTVLALIICVLLFAIMHLNVKGASVLSVSSTAIEAGLLLSAGYIFSRSLWLPIFLHFAWDFAEPGVFGAINPGITLDQSLITSKIEGPLILTGGQQGPQTSIQSLILCTIASLIFLWMARKKKNFIKPFWRRKNIS
jgi:membrane protease YdiL (CAAX protease family)